MRSKDVVEEAEIWQPAALFYEDVRGVDIIAHLDAFGFQTPQIKVQVKHGRRQATAPEVRALAGTARENECGLFASTGGFTSDAPREPKRRSKIARIDLKQFARFLLENYEKAGAPNIRLLSY